MIFRRGPSSTSARDGAKPPRSTINSRPNSPVILNGRHFSYILERLDELVPLFRITEKEKKIVKLIPYWKHPGDLKGEPTTSRTFLRWLDKWLYGDTSAQAHLSFGGLFVVSPFLVAELVGGQSQEIVEGRMIHQYRFHQFSRTALVTLAIATEIDCYCNLGNREVISYLWALFSEHAPESKEMYRARYEAKLSSRSVA